ncbi:MAG: zf-HC2 domain-containing protein, partial [Anaerolineae bacterium]|nr:zf-HC2 domain-containing protein [Anaerolineae bacterium]
MHTRWQEMLPYYLNGTLSPEDRAALETHLAGCPACRRELEEWRLIGGVVREEVRDWVSAPAAILPETRAKIALAVPASANGRHSGAGYPYPRPQARPVQRPLGIQRPSLSIQR